MTFLLNPRFCNLVAQWNSEGRPDRYHSLHLSGEGQHDDLPVDRAIAASLQLPIHKGNWYYFSDLVDRYQEGIK